MDHIMPLARGGKHSPANIQLLCPPCNLRKSAKHPIDYMRQLGWLL
jgi:5-methylcytosine-specific restriction endonuclease McrA